MNDPASSADVTFVPGSFRDRSSRVFIADGQVCRALSVDGLKEWRTLSAKPFFARLMSEGHVIETHEVSGETTSHQVSSTNFVGALRHATIPFISYPYEWSFGMLKDAAGLQLQILSESLRNKTMLKDASPYNIQFRGCRPVFIDVGSFEAHKSGTPWSAYQQFCELFLYPLLLQAYRGIDFTTLLRGELEGVSVEQCARMLRFKDAFRAGVFSHVVLHRLLGRATQKQSTSTLKELQQSGFSDELVIHNVDRLHRLVEKLNWKPNGEPWVDYDQSSPMVAQDADAKATFVRDVVQSRDWNLAWDLGCNRGRYSIIAAARAKCVLAMDRDQGCVELLYRSLKDSGPANVLPLVMNVANQSPGLGWRGRERMRLEERGQPDLILCLGLIHHLVISANLPLPEVIDWLRSLHATLIIEFPTRQDPMVQALLRNKKDQYSDYSLEHVEALLGQSFQVVRREQLPSTERVLFHCEPQRFDVEPLTGVSHV